MNYETYADKPSKYFLNLEKRNYARKTIYRLKNQQGQIIDKDTEILEEIRLFYQKLYTSEMTDLETYVDKLEVPQLSEATRKQLDAPISMTEVSEVLKDLNNNRCPGNNGIPPEFWKVFHLKTKPLLHGLMQEIAHDEEMHLTAKQGVLSLMEKVGKDPLKLDQWRPLTLLNSDNKLYMKIMAKCLQLALPEIIHSTQKGFVPSRYMSENIIQILEAMNKCDKTLTEAVLISFDFYKAFDTVEWNSLFKAYELFGFGAEYRRMLRPIFKDPMIVVMNNGTWSNYMKISRGCRQGCCYSPGAFTILIELLGLGIRNNQNIEGIKIGKTTVLVGQFADDLWTIVKATSNNINAVVQEIETFGSFSGLRLNYTKTAILRVGPFTDSEAKCYTLRQLFWSPGPIRILGIMIYPDRQVMYEENFLKPLEKIKDTIAAWKLRTTTLIGRIIVVNCLINTLFTHKFMCLPDPPKSFFQKYKEIVLDFLWESKRLKIKYERLIQDHHHLGLKLIDLQMKNSAMKAAWPSRWVNRDSDLDWFYETLPIKDRRIWYVNTSPQDVLKFKNVALNGCNVSYDIWKAWTKFSFQSTLTNPEDICNTIIWANSLIQRQLKPIMWRKLIDSNIETILDIYDSEHKRLFSYDQVVQNFGPVITFLEYCQVCVAIPSLWRQLLKNFDLDKILDYEYPLDRLFNGKIKPSKRIYWSLVETKYPQNNALRLLWETDLGIKISNETWSTLFVDFLQLIKLSKLRLCQYRILNRALTTNVKRSKWDKKVSELCSFCNSSQETVIHLLCDCIKVKPLWKAWSKLVDYYCDVKIDPEPELILLNNYKGANKFLVNFTLIVMKQYLYASQCLASQPNFMEFMTKLSYYCSVDKGIAYENNKIDEHYECWKQLF